MRHEYARWTFVEITRLRKLLSEGKTHEQIACHLGMKVQRVKERVRHENRTPEQKREKYDRATELREKNKIDKPRRFISHPHGAPVVPHIRPTPEMIEEAYIRANAPRSLSATLLGDPPEGFSALDRRQNA